MMFFVLFMVGIYLIQQPGSENAGWLMVFFAAFNFFIKMSKIEKK